MAGRIPQQFIDDLLTRIDIVDVIDSYVPLRKAGRNHQARCPFHEEKTPSFTVSQEKQFYHCFGCGANGTAISFLMDYTGKDFVEAIEDLASRIGLEVPREGGVSPKDSGLTELFELMEMVIKHYSRQLREHPEAPKAVEYLKSRGLSGQLAAEFELGFAPSGWDGLIKSMGLSDASLQRLDKIGMIIKSDKGSYYDRFRDRIIFPIRDQRGRAIGIGGRVLGEGTPKYLNSPETPIFHKGRELYGLYQAKRKQRDLERVFVVEGYMDVLALAQHGISNAVATLGTAVTPDHLDRLFKVCPQLVFCFDGDTAGQKAAWRALEIALPLLHEGRQAYFMFMPEGDDPDSFVRNHGSEQFNDSSHRVPLSEYLLNHLKETSDMSTREGEALLADKALPYLTKLPPGALRELLLNDLSTISRVPSESLRALLAGKQPVTLQKAALSRSIQKPSGKLPNLPNISKTIRLLLNHPELGRDSHFTERLSGIQDKGVDFLRELLDYIQQHPTVTCAGILEHWRDTPYGPRLQVLAGMEEPLSSVEVNPEEINIKKQFMDYISMIERDYRKKQRDVLLNNLSSPGDLRKLSDT